MENHLDIATKLDHIFSRFFRFVQVYDVQSQIPRSLTCQLLPSSRFMTALFIVNNANDDFVMAEIRFGHL